MAVNGSENKSVKPDEDKGIVRAANGVATTSPVVGNKDVKVTLAGHFRYDDEDHVPGDVITVPADLAESLYAAGYAVRDK